MKIIIFLSALFSSVFLNMALAHSEQYSSFWLALWHSVSQPHHAFGGLLFCALFLCLKVTVFKKESMRKLAIKLRIIK